jgi:hypothetical protein
MAFRCPIWQMLSTSTIFARTNLGEEFVRLAALAAVLGGTLYAPTVSAAGFFQSVDLSLAQYCGKMAFEGASLQDVLPAIRAAGFEDMGTMNVLNASWGQIYVVPAGKTCTVMVTNRAARSQIKGLVNLYVSGLSPKLEMVEDGKRNEKNALETTWKGPGRTAIYLEWPEDRAQDATIKLKAE